MGNNRPIKTKCWENFLISIGCKFKRNKGSHHIWGCPNCMRPIVFWGNKKDIPALHIQTDLKTLGIERKYFLSWVDKNC